MNVLRISRSSRKFIVLALVGIASLSVSPTGASASNNSSIRQKMVKSDRSRSHAKCDIETAKNEFVYNCTVEELEAALKPFQIQLTDVETNYANLVSSNIELLCNPSLEEWQQWAGYWDLETHIDREKMYGPCYIDSAQRGSSYFPIYFPCSKPNLRFESKFPSDYWDGYYESVEKSQLYGSCTDDDGLFSSGVGLSYTFRSVWISRWSKIFGTYKSLIVQYLSLYDSTKILLQNLETAKLIPKHRPGDCQLSQSDPTKGFVKNGKTAVDSKGYLYKCVNSTFKRAGRASYKAVNVYCPSPTTPTGNNCWADTSWGTSIRLAQLPAGRPSGAPIGSGQFVSITGFDCIVKVYSNFAYRESCSKP